MLNPQLSSTNFAASTLAYSLPSTKVETQSPLRRRSQIHPLYVNHFESPPYSAFTTGAVNWDLYPDQLKEAVAGLEVLGEPYLKELQALVSTTSRQLISHTSVPRCNFTEHARHQYLYPVHLHNFGSVLPTATQNKASPCQIKGVEHLPSSGVTASNCDRRFSHNTPIRNLAALQYLQNPPSKHDLITCTVKESEAVAGEKDGETLEEIEDGWTKPAVCRNERELKRQAYALLAHLERSTACSQLLTDIPKRGDSKWTGNSRKIKRPLENEMPVSRYKLNVNKQPAWTAQSDGSRQE